MLADLEPFYDIKLINDPANLEAIFSNQWLNFNGPNNRSLLFPERQVPLDSARGTFQLPPEKIENLRQLVKVNKSDQQGKKYPFHTSTFSLASAYIWPLLVRAEGIKDKKVVLHFPVDCRSRLEPPLPSTYFGNYISAAYAVVETDLLFEKEGFSIAVTAISEAIKNLANNGVLEGAENWVSRMTGISSTPSLGRVFQITSSHRFGYYSTDFGRGQPRKVDAVWKRVAGLICFWDRRSGDAGVEIGLVLKKYLMEAFTSLICLFKVLNLFELAATYILQ